MKNRSRRLRKKLHVGEFTEIGIDFSFKHNDENDFDYLYDKIMDSLDCFNRLCGTNIILGCGTFCNNYITGIFDTKLINNGEIATIQHLEQLLVNVLFSFKEPYDIGYNFIDVWNGTDKDFYANTINLKDYCIKLSINWKNL